MFHVILIFRLPVGIFHFNFSHAILVIRKRICSTALNVKIAGKMILVLKFVLRKTFTLQPVDFQSYTCILKVKGVYVCISAPKSMPYNSNGLCSIANGISQKVIWIFMGIFFLLNKCLKCTPNRFSIRPSDKFSLVAMCE